MTSWIFRFVMEVSVSMRRTLSNPEKIDDIDVSVVVSFYSLSLSLYMVVHLYIVHTCFKSIKDMVGFYYKAKRKGHYIISTVYNSLSICIYMFLGKVMFPLIFFGKSPPSKFPNFLNPKNQKKNKNICFKTSPMDFLVLNSRKMPLEKRGVPSQPQLLSYHLPYVFQGLGTSRFLSIGGSWSIQESQL